MIKVVLTLVFALNAFGQDLKEYTTFKDGEVVKRSLKAPEFAPDDFYVKRLGFRMKREPGTKESPYKAMLRLCEGKKDGLGCYYLSEYHDERNQKVSAAKFQKLACEYDYKEACK